MCGILEEPNLYILKVYEYIFGKNETIGDSTIDINVLNELRNEFRFWMPADVELFTGSTIRTIGLCTLFDSIELLGEENCPKSVYLTPATFRIGMYRYPEDRPEVCLRDCPADAIRLVFAGILDTTTEAVYFDKKQDLDTAVLQLTKEFKWIREVYESETLSETDAVEFPEKLFANQINQAILSSTEAFDKYVLDLFLFSKRGLFILL